jgi:hypothetical protein
MRFRGMALQTDNGVSDIVLVDHNPKVTSKLIVELQYKYDQYQKRTGKRQPGRHCVFANGRTSEDDWAAAALRYFCYP